MPRKLEVLLASRSKEKIDELAAELQALRHYKVVTRHIVNGHADPLYGLEKTPDVVVFLLNDNGHADLESLIEEQTPGRPPMIVMSGNGDSETMRLAMRAGARDFLLGEVSPGEFAESIDRVAAQLVEDDDEQRGQLTIFVNAKGGSGATFIGSNTAHILASVSDKSTALMSLDLQFDGLAQYFDTELRHGLMEVLESVETLDEVALDAYMTQHESGLRILAAAPEDVIQCHSDRAGQLGMLLDKMLAHYEHVVIDIPRRIDPYMVPVLERADRVVLVVQQTLGHLHDAKRMLKILGACGISASQILVVVNRYDKHSPIALDDIKRTLKGTEVSLVPSDFRTVAESINLGIPINEHARASAVSKALLSLEAQIGGHTHDVPGGLLSKAFSNIMRKEKWSRA